MKRQKKRDFWLFKRWILAGITIDTLLNLGKEKLSGRTLRRHFERYLQKSPQFKRLNQPQKIYLKIDAVYFKKEGCVLVYKTGKEVIYWSCQANENFQAYGAGLRTLRRLGYDILGVTSDKHGSIIAAVKVILPRIPHQYCLVHLQRSSQSLLTKKPETEAGRELLEIVSYLNQIKNSYERNIWLKWFRRYEERYEEFIKERSYGMTEEGRETWWYTHKNLRRAFRTIKNSLDNMFLYLEYLGLEKDTNGLEAEFTHLKHKLRTHRGLKRWKKKAFVKWYFYLKSR